MRFTQSFMDEIRDRVPISDVIGTRVTWDKRKTNTTRGDYWACCPFHGENTPSFHCEDKKGRYYCFGCQASGDHFRFLTEHDGMSFPEAVEKIAAMAGVAMPAPDPQAEARERERASLYEVMEWATAWYEEHLQTSAGAAARAYLSNRGLKTATIAKFRLGYAPDSRKALKEHLASKGASREQIEATGMVIHGDDIPVSYDRFRDRIMFPIEDGQGRIIAFGGRALSADVPAKYLNSPETALFHKSDVLFNYKRARQTAARGDTMIAVEGYMDVIALDQAGIENAVAPLGTALTERQLEMLWRVTPEPVLCFDGDNAGLKAAFRSADLALPNLKAGRTLRFALLPDGKDPDDIVNAGGREAFADVLAHARSLVDLVWMRETRGHTFETPERRAQLEATLRQVTAQITDESVRRHYGQEMRERTRAFFGTGTETSRGRPGSFAGSGPAGRKARIAVSERLTASRMLASPGSGQASLPLRECAILSAVICHPDLLAEHFDVFVSLDFESSQLGAVRSAVIKAYGDNPVRLREELMAHPAMRPIAGTVDGMDATVSRARLWVMTGEASIDDAREGFRQAVELHRSAGGLMRELKAAEQALADHPSDSNLQRLVDIQAQMSRSKGLEALVEGFGVSSGRPVKSF